MKKAKKIIALVASVLIIVSAFTAMFALADGTEVIWKNSFDTEEEREEWEFYDLDGDEKNWMWKSNENDAGYPTYDGLYSMYSESWDTVELNNVAVSEAFTISEASAPDLRIKWYVAAQDFGLAHEQYSIYVIKESDTIDVLENISPIFTEKLSEKTVAYHDRSVDITNKVKDLFGDENTERKIRIVFKHHTEEAMFALKIDAVSVEAYYNYDMLAEYDFEDGLQGWTTIDGDGDGHNWEHLVSSLHGLGAHNSDGCMASASYDDETLTPENYIVSPEIEISKKYSSPLLSWYVGSYDEDYYAENYSLYIYSGTENLTSSNIKSVISGLEPVYSETLAAYEYAHRNVDLGRTYAGEKVRLIFVHHDCSDIYWLKIDNVVLKAYDSTSPIETIEVTGINKPVIGETYSNECEAMLVSDGKNVTPTEANLVWQMLAGDEYVNMSEGERFVTGTVYRASVTVSVSEDFIFTDSIVTDEGATLVSIDESLHTVTVAYDFAPQYSVTWKADSEKTVYYTAGETISLPEAPEKKEGHTFKGWSGYTNGMTMPAENLIFNAEWTVNEYTVTWIVDGLEMFSVDYAYGAKITDVPNASKAGYTLKGWNGYTDGMTMPAENKTFTAVFEANKYNATFLADGGVFEENGTDTYVVSTAYDSAIVAPANPTKTGYVFSGWTPATGMDKMDTVGGETYTATWTEALNTPYTVNVYTMNTEGTYDAPVVYNLTGKTNSTATYVPEITDGFVLNTSSVTEGTIAEDGSLVLNVYIDRKSYKLITVVDGNETSTEYLFGAEIKAPEEPEKEGYDFSGWDATVPATMPAYDITLTGSFTANVHTVTYYIDGVEYDKIENVAFGTLVTYTETPEKEGYDFSGWDKIAFIMPDEDVKVKGSWNLKKGYWEYKVETYLMGEDGNYDSATPTDAIKIATNTDAEKISTSHDEYPQDGKFTADTENENNVTEIEKSDSVPSFKLYFRLLVQKILYVDEKNMTTPSEEEYYYGAEYTLPEPRDVEGYTFQGWKAEGSEEVIPASTPVNALPETDGEVKTYTAVWAINQHTITFADTGDVAYEAITQDYGTEIIAPADPIKTGYTFAGWDIEIPSTMPDEDMTITAKWTINQYTITFADTGDVAYEAITQDYGTEITAPADPTKTGYALAGWIWTDTESGEAVEAPSTIPAYNVTATAQWVQETYNVIFKDSLSEDVYGEGKNLVCGAPVSIPENPAKEGYTFGGWADADDKKVDPIDTMTDIGDSGATIIYKAIWNANSYYIEFYDSAENGNWLAGEEQLYGKSITTPAEPTKTGHTFIGWYDAEKKPMPETVPAVEDQVYYAHFTINKYTATFYMDETKEEKHFEDEYVFQSVIPEPETPVKEGYAFEHWSKEGSTNKVVFKETAPKMGAGDINYIAQWTQETYTVIFKDSLSEDVYSEKTLAYGASVSIPVPEKKGYTFNGWADANGNETAPMSTMEDIGDSGASIVYTAIWQINQYTITFDTDGGNEIPAIIQDYATAIAVPANPTKTGYTFAGWDAEIPSTMPAENMTITAQWEINTYTVSWDVDGVVTEETYEYGAEINKPADPTKQGYVFNGWSPEVPATQGTEDATYTATWANATDTPYTVETYFMGLDGTYSEPATETRYGETTATASVTPAENTGFTLDTENSVLSGTIAADGSLVLKVYYSRNSYNVKTVSDGKEIKSTPYYYGAVIAKPDTPVKEGNTFNGWNGYTDGMTMPANDVTLTAQWKVNQYTITFDTKGGTAISSITLDYGTKIAAVTAPTKTGHTFAGWDKTIPSTMPAYNMTITAKWNVNSYTVTWIADGKETKTTVKYGEKIAKPADPAKSGYRFDGWKGYTDGMTMPAENKTFTASFSLVVTMSIRNPSQTTISYGDSITLHAVVNGVLPQGWSVKWTADNARFGYSASSDGITCDITPSSSGATVFTATVYDETGKEIVSDTQTMNSKAGFFDKIIGTIKGWFGLTKHYDN